MIISIIDSVRLQKYGYRNTLEILPIGPFVPDLSQIPPKADCRVLHPYLLDNFTFVFNTSRRVVWTRPNWRPVNLGSSNPAYRKYLDKSQVWGPMAIPLNLVLSGLKIVVKVYIDFTLLML